MFKRPKLYLFIQWVNNHPIVIGGLNPDGTPRVVEIDETKYFHRKYARGAWHEGHWVLGAIEQGNPHNAFLVEIPDRRAITLLPIISEHVDLGTMIHTDQWSSYNNTANLPQGYGHMTVNHSENFVDPNTGVHTQGIEGFWAHAKKKVKRMNGTSRPLFDSYLKEFEWRWRNDIFAHGDGHAFQKFLLVVSEQYPL